MKPWTSWLARLGLAGSCMIWVGCGGSDVPDPSSDAHAAPDAPPSSAAPSAPAPVAQAEPDAPAPAAEPAPPAKNESTTSASAESAAATDSGGEDKAPAKSEAPSATNEMLSLANAPAAASSDKPAGATADGAPGGSGPNGNPNPTDVNAAMAASGLAAPGSGSGSGSRDAMAGSGGSMGQFQPIGGGGDMGGEANLGQPGGPIPTETFRLPWTAASAFLAALKTKDSDKLAQTTALRAPLEGSPKYQKVFTAILERSLAPEDLDELAKKFEGYTVIGQNQPKSTGKFEIIVSKMQGTSQLHRTITLRKERAGWKVTDISGSREFERPILMPRGGTRGGRR